VRGSEVDEHRRREQQQEGADQSDCGDEARGVAEPRAEDVGDGRAVVPLDPRSPSGSWPTRIGGCAVQDASAQELDLPTMTRIAVAVSTVVQGAALALAHEARVGQQGQNEWLASRQGVIDRAFASGRLPMVSRFGAAEYRAAAPEAIFEFGLQRTLDGIATLLSTINQQRVRRARISAGSFDSVSTEFGSGCNHTVSAEARASVRCARDPATARQGHVRLRHRRSRTPPVAG
jgi:hypothetical protein